MRSRMALASRAWVSSNQRLQVVKIRAQSLRLGSDGFTNPSSAHRASDMNGVFVRYKVSTTFLCGALLVACGCVAYTPVQLRDSRAGYNVRISLSDQGTVDLAPKIGARARQLEGTVKQSADSSIVLSVRRVSREGGGDDTYDSLDVAIPLSDIASVERSQTSVSRSVLTAGAIVATALLAARGAGDVTGGKGGGPPPVGK